jgi:hypothetical protein
VGGGGHPVRHVAAWARPATTSDASLDRLSFPDITAPIIRATGSRWFIPPE